MDWGKGVSLELCSQFGQTKAISLSCFSLLLLCLVGSLRTCSQAWCIRVSRVRALTLTVPVTNTTTIAVNNNEIWPEVFYVPFILPHKTTGWSLEGSQERVETNLAEVDLLGLYLSVGLFLLPGRCAISLQPITSSPFSTKALAEGGRILLCGMDAIRHPFSGVI